MMFEFKDGPLELHTKQKYISLCEQVPYVGHVLIDSTQHCGGRLAEAKCPANFNKFHANTTHGSTFFTQYEYVHQIS